MKLTVQQSTLRSLKADALALFVPGDKAGFTRALAELRRLLGVRLNHILELENFKGMESECCTILSEKKLSTPRVLLIGLGESKKFSLEHFRRAGAVVRT